MFFYTDKYLIAHYSLSAAWLMDTLRTKLNHTEAGFDIYSPGHTVSSARFGVSGL
jgi:hypothetical protein